jgi:hypothetical protein
MPEVALAHRIHSTRLRGARAVRFTAALCLIGSVLAAAPANAELGCAAGTSADLAAVLDRLDAGPAPGWIRINANSYSDVWTPSDLRPLYGSSNPGPQKILHAWSGFAWDCRRGQILLYGGGHANYPGNDTYSFDVRSGLWKRMSLPSQITKDALGNYTAIDGAFAAPASAHTYDNNVYLPIVDRLLVLGGAAFNNGGAYKLPTGPTTARTTGPYVLDPALANPNRVGGTTGSHVQRVSPYPNVVGSMMWQNRDLYQFMSNLPVNFVNGVTAYAREAGHDVVYVNGVSGGTHQQLYRYVVRDPVDALQDTFEIVGTYYYGFSGRGAGGFDPARRIFVRTAVGATPWFVYLDLTKAGPGNRNGRFLPQDLSGAFALDRGYGLDFDVSRNQYLLWAGGPAVWALKAPATLSEQGWTIARQPVAATIAPPTPPMEVGGGVLGKWKYVPELDAFIAIEDEVKGNVWIYKPAGWQRPGGPAVPGVTITANPSTVITGNASVLTWWATTATSCTAEGAWAGTKPTSGTQSTGALTQTSTFGLRCQGAGGEGFASVTVQVLPLPAPQVTISAQPAAVLSGGSSQLTWSATNATSCAASGGWSGSRPVSGTQSTGPLMLATSFVLTCSGPGGQGSAQTNVTIQAPVNQPPQVAITAPSTGANFLAGTPIVISATATDDGQVTKVEFFDGTTKIGEDSIAPYSIEWIGAASGGHSLTARATDNAGVAAVSGGVSIFIAGGGGTEVTVTLQRGVVATRDTYLSNYHRSNNFGLNVYAQDQSANYTDLVRFAIFQSEGGPVPDGAQVTSAVLSLYKYSNYDMIYGVHQMLKNWTETGATWLQTGAGASWTVAGANGAGSDHAAVADSTASTGFNPEWVSFDVTPSVAAFATSPSTNFGWRLKGVSGYTSGLKRFHMSEYATAPELRPKLVVSYQ